MKDNCCAFVLRDLKHSTACCLEGESGGVGRFADQGLRFEHAQLKIPVR